MMFKKTNILVFLWIALIGQTSVTEAGKSFPAGTQTRAALPSDLYSSTVSIAREFWLYTPGHEVPEAGYPLMIYLHGIGRRSDTLGSFDDFEVADIINRVKTNQLNMMVVVPRCAKNGGDGWWNANDLQKLLTHLKGSGEYQPIDENRIILMGFSMGSYGTFDWAKTYPEQFAAIAPCSGAPGAEVRQSFVDAIYPIPAWLRCGATVANEFTSKTDGYAWVTINMKNALNQRKAQEGLPPCQFVQEVNEDHGGSRDRHIEDLEMFEWMLRQTRTGMNIPPTVSVVGPVLSVPIETGREPDLDIVADDVDGSVVSVTVLIDGHEITSETASSFSLSDAFDSLSTGSHLLEVVATDNEGAETLSSHSFQVIDPVTSGIFVRIKDSFQRSGSLNGSSPEAGANWVAAAEYTTDGARAVAGINLGGNRTAVQPFEPQPGNRYLLSAEMTLTGIGESETNAAGIAFWNNPAQSSGIFNDDDSVLSVALRGNGELIYDQASPLITISENNPVLHNRYHFALVLDTNPSLWTYEVWVNGQCMVQSSFAENPTITGVGIGKQSSPGIEVDNFRLALLKDAAPLRISAILIHPDGPVTLSWQGQTGRSYTLQRATNLTTGSWSNVTTGVSGSGLLSVKDAEPYDGRVFYLVMEEDAGTP
jgi:pimeloyl-ACP methyl ester carboxylesterase